MQLRNESAIWTDAPLKAAPADSLPQKIQRIFSARRSDVLEESQMDDPDEALLRQSQSGDPAAFEPLITKYQRMIFSLAYRMTGSLDDAEDLTQETFIRAYRNLASYRGASKFSTWLYRIAVNACLNWRQRETMRGQIHSKWAEEEAARGPDAGSDAGARVHEALLKLSPKQRAAIMLTIYDGFSHAAAAKILGCSEATVSWRVFIARGRLKGWLTAHRDEKF